MGFIFSKSFRRLLSYWKLEGWYENISKNISPKNKHILENVLKVGSVCHCGRLALREPAPSTLSPIKRAVLRLRLDHILSSPWIYQNAKNLHTENILPILFLLSFLKKYVNLPTEKVIEICVWGKVRRLYKN